MYSSSSIAVDKGLGIDFSEIVTGVTETVKSALPVGLNIFQQQMQLKQIKAMQQPGYIPSPSIYGQPYNILPISRTVPPQTNVPMPYYPPSQGMSTTTMLLIGGVLLGGLVLYKATK